MPFESIIGQFRIWDKKAGGEFVDFVASEYPFLSGISVTIGVGVISTLSITLDMPYDVGIEKMNSTLFAKGNLVAVRMGYSDLGMMTPWFFGNLTEGGNGLVLSPNGVGGAINATDFQRPMVYKAYNQTTPSNAQVAISLIADRLGYELEMKPDAMEILGKRRGIAYNWNYTNYELLKQICSACGLVFWLGFKDNGDTSKPTMFVFSEKDLTDGTPTRQYAMRGKFDPANNIWPILEMSPTQNKATWDGEMPEGAGSGARSSYFDDVTGEVVTIDVSPEQLEHLVHGYVADATPEDDGVDDHAYDAAVEPTESPAVVATVSNGSEDGKTVVEDSVRARVLGGAASQEMTISTIGSPLEQPGGMILVRGCSLLYDGSYYVKTVTHTFAPGDYSTSLFVQRRGTLFKSGKEVESAGGQASEEVPSA